MQTLKIELDPHSQYCVLKHPYNKRFVSFLTSGIQPTSYRRYDPGTKCWMVHVSRLPLIVSFGRRYFDHVDYRALPPDLQIRVVRILKGQEDRRTNSVPQLTVPVDPHATLYVTQNAPWVVIKAAYRALAQTHHPDHGGSTEAFQKIQTAFEQLKYKQKS